MRVVVIGEGMLELVAGAARPALGYGGDALNTAIHLARYGHDVAFATALGADRWSEDLRARWRAEGLDTSLILTDRERLPGLYGIHTDPEGERSFTYWRSDSAARRLFALPGAGALADAAARADLLFFSLISLAILPPAGRAALLDVARGAGRAGARVAFDGNYRPRLWRSPAEAREARDAAVATCDIGLPTLGDEALLADAADGPAVAAEWARLGAGETVVKLGADGCLVAGRLIAPERRLAPVDTSGAGDAFDAGYLARRLDGADQAAAAAEGHRLAAWTLSRWGAVPPPDADAPYPDGGRGAAA